MVSFSVCFTLWTKKYSFAEVLFEHDVCPTFQGSYQCGYCDEGYAGVSTHKCYPTNYCETGEHKCHSKATCIYLRPTEYKCKVRGDNTAFILKLSVFTLDLKSTNER